MRTKLLVAAIVLGLTFGAKASYPSVSLWNIQYSTVDSCGALPNSPYAGQYVVTGGIVTALYGYGYYVQTSYANKWAAINVYDKYHSPAVGDSIVMTAQVIEYYNETELDSVKSLTIVSTGNQARTPATVVALDSIQRREYQGMLVKVKNTTCVRYNTAAAWYVFSDSTMTKGVNSEDTVDNIIMTSQTYTPGQKYNITGVIHLEYANWIEPRNANDIVGVANIQNNNIVDVNIFPNPNQGVFTASIDVLSGGKNSEVTVMDMTGRVIMKNLLDLHAGNNSIPINISNLEKGTYFVQLTNTNGTAVRKVVLQ
jgi:predicted extracellular nuclease